MKIDPRGDPDNSCRDSRASTVGRHWGRLRRCGRRPRFLACGKSLPEWRFMAGPPSQKGYKLDLFGTYASGGNSLDASPSLSEKPGPADMPPPVFSTFCSAE